MVNEYFKLKKIVKKLREPEKGCPWDRKQTVKTLLKYFKSELNEFKKAVDKNDYSMMKEELGDILLLIFMCAQIAGERGKFKIEDVFAEINRKLIRRHPHVFGKEKVNSASEVIRIWKEIKKNEKKCKNQN